MFKVLSLHVHHICLHYIRLHLMKVRLGVIFVAIIMALSLYMPFVHRIHAAPLDPWSVAFEMRALIFQAQTALTQQDVNGAKDAIRAASTLYTEHLQSTIQNANTIPNTLVLDALDSMTLAIETNDLKRFAAGRGLWWGHMLNASATVTLKAVETNDLATAQAWLLLREFRTSTKFTRPNADATLAMRALSDGKMSMNEALPIIKIDLFDTYQAKLNEALADGNQANQRSFTIKRAETAGLAKSYYQILAETYAQQRGANHERAAAQSFSNLVTAAIEADSNAFHESYQQIENVLLGFRAAPLTEADQARRGGQLLRFLNLVPLEYGRGVRDGKVIHDIEIQEALTFRSAAWAAFLDIEPVLMQQNAPAAAQIKTALLDLESQIQRTVEPLTLENNVNQLVSQLQTLMPAAWQTVNIGSDFDVLHTVLDQIRKAVQQGDYLKAESARVEAYAILDSGIEQKLLGFAPDIAFKVESLFWQGDSTQVGLAVLIANHAPKSDITAALRVLETELKNAETVLSGKSAPAAVVGNAAIIVFREGLEAVLILASLIASLRTAETRKFRNPIIVGAAFALIGSALTWWVANGILMSLIRFGERLEAIVSLIAIGVLLVITNWFFHKVYWTGWMANFHSQKGKIIAGGLALGQIVSLMILGFSSIYREGFETVLFLQSLVLDAGLGTVLEGVALGMVGVVIVGVITFALQMRLPYKQMLIVTGIMIGVVLLMMVGNTVHVMQAVGWLPITPIHGVNVPYWLGQWFGLFPTWQGLGFQLAAAVFVIGSYYLAEYENHKKTTSSKTQTAHA